MTTMSFIGTLELVLGGGHAAEIIHGCLPGRDTIQHHPSPRPIHFNRDGDYCA
jgi:hypothetical protein